MNRFKKTRRHEARAVARPGYLHRLGELRRVGMTPPGRVSLVTVAHDGWCPALAGRARECCPEIGVEVLPPPEPDWSLGPTEADLRALDDLDGPDPRDEDGR